MYIMGRKGCYVRKRRLSISRCSLPDKATHDCYLLIGRLLLGLGQGYVQLRDIVPDTSACWLTGAREVCHLSWERAPYQGTLWMHWNRM